MEVTLPWSNGFDHPSKKTKKFEQWMIVDVAMEEELQIEVFLRHIYNNLDPEDMPNFISALAKDNLRLLKMVSQSCDHMEKLRVKNSKKI
tara:strand:- start:640 stop:909 length:270 start_codon:yes stop_codon:yes gene_type:complete